MDMMDTPLTFGQWVQHNRRAQEWTQAELSERVFYSIHTIRKLENDTIRPSSRLLPLLAHVFGVAPADYPAFVCWALSARPQPSLPPGQEGTRLVLSSLPQWPTTLIGRAVELGILVGLLQQPAQRLLTLTGPGGVGKTRLAAQAALQAMDWYRDGVWFVNLTPVQDSDELLPQLAAAMGIRCHKNRSVVQQLAVYLRGKQILLVLDNAEHLVAAGPQIAALVSQAPQLTILVTSRRPLPIYGSQTIALTPLAVPPEHATPEQVRTTPAGQLFVERAHVVCPTFALTDTTAPVVAAICARLEGLPLALELAAARLRILPPRALFAQLARPCTVLTGGPRDLPARQQSLRASLDWSYTLLTEEEQALFRRLAVFPAGATLAAITAVCCGGDGLAGHLLDGLDTLVAASLLRVETTAEANPWYRMPALVHAYAAILLADHAEAANVRHRYARFLAARAPQPVKSTLRTGATPTQGRVSPASRPAVIAEERSLSSGPPWPGAGRDPPRLPYAHRPQTSAATDHHAHGQTHQ